LVLEEMRRVLCFLDWKGSWWEIQGGLRTDVTGDVADGLQAYAAKSAQVCRNLASSFAKEWCKYIKSANLSVDFPKA
jgi:hypothetical protein